MGDPRRHGGGLTQGCRHEGRILLTSTREFVLYPPQAVGYSQVFPVGGSSTVQTPRTEGAGGTVSLRMADQAER